jgi:hypothetical protein
MVPASKLAVLLLAAATSAVTPSICFAQGGNQPAQAAPSPCKVAPQPQPCATSPATSPTEKFPFPGETPDPPAASTPTPSATQTPDAPTSAAPASKPSGADFPFPGTDPAASSGSSSSSSSSSSADHPFPGDTDPDPPKPALQDKGSEGATTTPGRHILHRVNPIGTKLQSDDEREQEDLDIAHYYTQSGDLPGALLRAQDAVKIKPDDPDAHFALAEAARRLNKKDQAIAEYEACLKLDPIDKEAAAARKALSKLK